MSSPFPRVTMGAWWSFWSSSPPRRAPALRDTTFEVEEVDAIPLSTGTYPLYPMSLARLPPMPVPIASEAAVTRERRPCTAGVAYASGSTNPRPIRHVRIYENPQGPRVAECVPELTEEMDECVYEYGQWCRLRRHGRVADTDAEPECLRRLRAYFRERESTQ